MAAAHAGACSQLPALASSTRFGNATVWATIFIRSIGKWQYNERRHQWSNNRRRDHSFARWLGKAYRSKWSSILCQPQKQGKIAFGKRLFIKFLIFDTDYTMGRSHNTRKGSAQHVRFAFATRLGNQIYARGDDVFCGPQHKDDHFPRSKKSERSIWRASNIWAIFPVEVDTISLLVSLQCLAKSHQNSGLESKYFRRFLPCNNESSSSRITKTIVYYFPRRRRTWLWRHRTRMVLSLVPWGK